MPLMLSQLFKNAEKLYNIKLIAGKNGMENTVRWVHMVEDAEVPDFLHGNELIFTTGIAKHHSGWLVDFTRHLHENHAAGLVVNLGPYVTDIPPQVIVYCEQNSFPIFTMPWKTRIIDVSYEFCRKIINNEKTEQSLAEAFKNLIMNPGAKESFAETLKKSGFSHESSYTAAMLEFTESSKNVTAKTVSENSSELSRILKTSPLPGAAFILDKKLIIIKQNSSPEDLRKLIQVISARFKGSESLCCTAGISQSGKGWAKVPEAYSQAKDSFFVAKLKNETICSYADIGVEKILLNVKNKHILQDFHTSTIGKLLEYDRENHSDYYELLKEYLSCGGSIQEVAAKTGVHRNTINYKIKQIKEILGKELSAEDRMNMMLGYIISDIIYTDK